MRHRAHALTVLLGVVLAPGLALADDFDRSGLYVGVGGAYGYDFFKDAIQDVVPSGVGVDVNDTGGLNARLGYRLFSWIAFEAHYEWMDEFTTDVSIPNVGTTTLDYTTHSFSGNLKFLLPIWRIQPYISLGVGGQYYILDESTGLIGHETGWAFLGRPAGGIDFYITKHWVVNAEAAGMLATTDINTVGQNVTDLFYVSVGGGIQYRF